MGLLALIEIAYADDPDGGPSDDKVISTRLGAMRRKMVPLGWTISDGKAGRPRIGFRLVEIAPKAVAA